MKQSQSKSPEVVCLAQKASQALQMFWAEKDLYNFNLTLFKARMINQQSLLQITQPLLHQQLYQQSLQAAKQKYLISTKTQTLQEIQQIACKLNQKRSKKKPLLNDLAKKNKMEVWAFGELKIFQAVCIIYSLLHSIELQRFTQAEYIFLKNIFLQKTENFLRYEVASLQKSRVKNNTQWRKNEIQLFISIAEQDQNLQGKSVQKTDWKYYSYQLFTLSKGRYYRTLQQCREKWTNYLNPHLSHAPWTIQEDILLFELIRQFGYKWSAISKQFGRQRTEHMVKNRFNSLVKAWKNKQFKNIPAEQIANKVLNFLNEKSNKSENLQKAQIPKLLDLQKGSQKGKKVQKVSPKPSTGQMLAQEMEGQECPVVQIEINLNQQSQMKSQSAADEYENVEIVVQPKKTRQQWDRHLYVQQNRQEIEGEDKEQKKTWDNQLEAHESYTQQPNLQFVQIQPLKDLQLLLLENYSQQREYVNNGVAQLLVNETFQRMSQSELWFQELQEKQMQSWLEL